MVQEGHEPLADSFKIIYGIQERRLVRIAETIMIQRTKPELNLSLGAATLRIHPSNLKPEFQRKDRTQRLVSTGSERSQKATTGTQVITHSYNLRTKTEMEPG
jgi:hypothetical protein